MWKKIAIFPIIMIFCMGLFIKTAKAEEIQEIEVDPNDVSSSLTIAYSCTNRSGYVTAYETDTRNEVYLKNTKIGVGGPLNTAFQTYQPYAENVSWIPLTDKVFESANYGNSYPIYINTCNYQFNYTLPQLSGWFQVEYDIYLGVTINALRANANTLTNSIVTDSAVDTYSDQYGHYFSIWYVDDDTTVQWMSGSNPQESNLLHFKATYIGASTPDALELNLGQYIADHISSWNAAGVYGNGYEYAFYMFQACTELTVGYMSTPPFTPTPLPTPYPGQDTQESINQNVDIIVNILDISATPVPTPSEIEIDPSDLESLEELTLPDVSSTQSTFADLWDIFAPAVPYLTMLVGSLLAVSVFMWILAGRWL